MFRTTTVIFASLVLASITSGKEPDFGNEWVIETVDTIAGEGCHISIALDSSDNPHISYYDETNGDLKYAYRNGPDWSIEAVDSLGDVGGYTSIALDSSGDPHISYYDFTNGDLKYAYFNGSNWSITTVDSSGDVGSWTSIALDLADRPRISYYDDTNRDLKCALGSGTSWLKTTVESNVYSNSSDGIVIRSKGTSIVIDSDDRIHIFYQSVHNNEPTYVSSLKIACYDTSNGNDWIIGTVDTIELDYKPGYSNWQYGVGSYASAVLDESGVPHISYSCGGLKYTYHCCFSWHDEIVSYDPRKSSLKLTSDNYPRIAFYSTPPLYLIYARSYGSSWFFDTVETVNATHVSNSFSTSSLVLDSNDIPRIAYSDLVNNDCLKYARYIPGFDLDDSVADGGELAPNYELNQSGGSRVVEVPK